MEVDWRTLSNLGSAVGGHLLAGEYAPRVLVVEDEVEVSRLFERTLSEDGYVVATARNGRQALSKLRDGNFDVVVQDLSLPDLDGLELTREIRADYPWIKILTISGYMVGHIHDLARAAGAAATLAKPLTVDVLRQGVYAVLDPAETWRARRAGGATNGD